MFIQKTENTTHLQKPLNSSSLQIEDGSGLLQMQSQEEEEVLQMACETCEEEEELQMSPLENVIQKDGEAETEVVEATETERREFVQEATRYLQEAGAFFQLSTIDAARLDRVLGGWQSTITNNENIINSFLNADATLLQNLRQAYTSSLRILMTRASSQLSIPLVKLYLQKMHLIPQWAWPGNSDFNLTTDAEKRAFIQATIDAFNDVATLSGFTTLNETVVRDILTRLKNLVNDQLEIITGDLGNDQTLRTSLHNAYQSSLSMVLTAAATQMGQSVSQLSVQFMDLIPEGMERMETNFSTPISLGLTPDASGNFVFTVNGIEITMLPDGSQTDQGAETSFNPARNRVSYRARGGIVSSVSGPNSPTAEIQTTYHSSASAGDTSAYGRGTTQTDQDRSNTSLGFHEGRHGLDFIQFVRDNSPPTFTGAIGDTEADFNTEITRWLQAWSDYYADMDAQSLSDTDCVGTTKDQHNASLSPPVITHHCGP